MRLRSLSATSRLIESDPSLLFLTMARAGSQGKSLRSRGAGQSAEAWIEPAALLRIHPELDAEDTEDGTPEDVLHHLNRVSFAKVPPGSSAQP
jgi:hypothetical protein